MTKEIATRSTERKREQMISNALFKAVTELDRCLKNKIFAHIIDGELRIEIQELRDRMERIRIKLNTPFHWTGPEKSRTENRGKLNVA